MRLPVGGAFHATGAGTKGGNGFPAWQCQPSAIENSGENFRSYFPRAWRQRYLISATVTRPKRRRCLWSFKVWRGTAKAATPTTPSALAAS